MKPIEQITVFGAGAIGGHIAARLARAGAKVSVVARGENLAAIHERGLRFISPSEDFTVRLRAVQDPRELGTQDLVIVTTKAHALPAAVDGLLPLLGAETPVVFAINGVPWWYFHGLPAHPAERVLGDLLDPGRRLHTAIGAQRAVGCVVRSPNDVSSPGIVRNHRTVNRFIFGEPDGSESGRLLEIARALQPALPGASTSSAIRVAVWDKVLQNLASSAISVLTRLGPAQAGDHPEVLALYEKIMAEGSAVARVCGVPAAPDARVTLDFVRSSPHLPSMLQDLLAGRPMEVDAQIRAVQHLGRAMQVATPTLDVVLALMRPLLLQDRNQPTLSASPQ